MLFKISRLFNAQYNGLLKSIVHTFLECNITKEDYINELNKEINDLSAYKIYSLIINTYNHVGPCDEEFWSYISNDLIVDLLNKNIHNMIIVPPKGQSIILEKNLIRSDFNLIFIKDINIAYNMVRSMLKYN